MAGQLQELAQTDFSGGLTAVTSPYLVSQKQIQRVRNLILDEHGSLSTRDGYSIVTTSTDTTSPIIYRGVLNRVDGNTFSLAIQQGAAVNTLYQTDVSPWTSVGTTSTAENIPDSFTAVNQQLILNGYESPFTYDGTTLARITALAGQTVPPGAKHGTFHLGYIWLWNTNASTTTLDGPSSLRTSDSNVATSWPNANQTFISKDDGQVGMGLAQYTIAEAGISPSQTLVAFKNYSGYQVTGVFGASNFSVQKIKSDMGCIAPRTIQFVSGYGIIRLSHRGYALYNGVDDRLLSEEVRPYVFGHDDIAGLNFSAIDRSWATQSQNPPLYIAACPVSGNTLTRVFIYDLVRKAWSICDFPVAFSSLALYTTPTTQPVVHAGSAVGGQIVKIFALDTSDNGSPVAWSFRSRPFFIGSFMRPTFWRRLIVDMLFVAPTQATTATATLLGLPATITKTMTYSAADPATLSRWGSAIWGQFRWGPGSTVDGRQDISIMKTAPAVTLDMSGTGNVRIRGLVFQGRTKPLNKVLTAA